MLYKVGVLPAHNDQQLDFAFTIYQTRGNAGYRLSREFKKTFATPVTVEFVGAWDTVSSVGIIPRSHPYTSVNYAVKHFRHALALDEHRARFRPNVWNEPTLEREQELDVDEPDVKLWGPGESRDDWVYEPPDRNVCDVEEVWFLGCHADVGGGSHNNRYKDSLSYIPLRWMIKECYLAQTGILFDHEYLKQLGFDLLGLAHTLENKGLDVVALGFDIKTLESEEAKKHSYKENSSPHITRPAQTRSKPSVMAALPHVHNALLYVGARKDAFAKIWDQLVITKGWWVLEVIPMLTTHQMENGDWFRERTPNFGQGRYIPFYDDQVKVHISVKKRIEETKTSENPYMPAAYNWDVVHDSGMLTYVD